MMQKVSLKITAILALSAGILGLSACDFRWARYYNREYKFSLLLPRGWSREEGLNNTVLTSRSPLKGRRDKFQENINVVVADLPKEAPDTPLDVLFELNKEEIMRVLPGVKEDISEGKIFAGRNEGRWLAFSNRIEGISIKIISAVWMRGKRVYVVTCSGEGRDFSKYEPVFKTTLRSLRIK